MPSIVVLLSHERSGSHLLGEFFGSLANVKMIDEICNPNAIKPLKHPESFFRFKYDAIVKDPKLFLEPTRDGHFAFMKSYFESLLAMKAPNSIVVDIKYGHVQNFEWWWWPVFERPFLLNYCESEKIGIVHLFRENVVEAAASAMIADRRKVWHSWQPAADAMTGRMLELPVRELVRKAKLLQQQTSWFKSCIGSIRGMAITYERLAAELGSGGELEATLAKFVGGQTTKVFNPRHQKLTPPLSEIVENYGAMKQSCEAAGLGEFVQ